MKKLNLTFFLFTSSWLYSFSITSDGAAFSYVAAHRDTFIPTRFPSAVGKHLQIRDVFTRNNVTILYEKEIKLTQNGGKNYLTLLYANHGGLDNLFYLILRNYYWYFPLTNNPYSVVQIMLLQADSLKTIKRAKEQVRRLFGGNKSCIHINDTHQETLKISKIIFFQRNIDSINK